MKISKGSLPLVISFPHSGTIMPDEVVKSVAKGILFPGTDWYLPQLFSFVGEIGCRVVENTISRHVIDVNRGQLAGIGHPNQCLVYTKNTMGRDIYVKNPDKAEMHRRIDAYYKPYHDAIACEIAEAGEKVWLFDIHSFAMGSTADIVLGNHNGRTMEEKHLQAIADIFTQNGFTVALNQPFRGGHVTKYHYKEGRTQTVQIELNYQSYIAKRRFGNEENPAVDETLWNDCRVRLEKSFEKIIEYIKTENHS
ncbi:MAG: N-formylglutamate amidohydrolase [Clostridia bacterium]|nr:N-formylglutamate amidohydrolase [Clostridia bacterium]